MRYYIILFFVFTITSSCSKAQSKTKLNTTEIDQKLDLVKKGKVIDYNSWLVTNKKDTISFKEFQNKWVLIDFWSTGCVPCIKEFPLIQKFYEAYKNDIQVIAVSVDNSFKRYMKGYRKYDLSIPNFYGGYSYSNPIFNLNIQKFRSNDQSNSVRYRTSVPQYVLIDPKGTIVDKNFPKPSSQEFMKLINKYVLSKK